VPRTSRRTAASHQFPVVSRRPDPRAWRAALVLANGDPHRIVHNADGSLTVLNQPRKRG
jgi:hypothetical protein